jgi:EmrB/QacA subfamily drug resistance transporter
MAERTTFQKNQWIVLITVMLASFLGRLDGTVVNLALPQIIKDFGITVSQASWISTAYIIANAIFVPIFGKLGDMIGRKPLYILGIVGFIVTSVLAGISFNLSSLIIFRTLQGVLVSIDYPLALSIIAVTFIDMGQRALAMGIWSAIFAVAQVLGPLIGGPLIDAFTWRSVFFINVPLGIIGTYMAIRFIKEPVKKIRGIKNFDISGAILLGISLGTLVLVLDQGQTWGWTSINSIAAYLISVVTLILFIITEQKQKEPIVDLKFFRITAFTAAIITSFISFMGLIGGVFLIPLFVQNLLGYTVTQSGYVFIPMAISLMVAAQIGARLSTHIEPRFLTSFGMFWAAIMMFDFIGIDIKWTFFDLSSRLALLAFGLGLGLSPLTNAATSTVPIEEVGVASSILALARNIAGAFGIAIFASILTNSLNSNLLAIQNHSIINSSNPQLIPSILGLMVIKANVLSYTIVFTAAGVVLLAGGVSALFVKQNILQPGIKKDEIQVAPEV